MNRIWNDGALKRLPFLLAITALTTSVLMGVVLWRHASWSSEIQPPTAQFLAILWIAIAIYLLAGNVRTRCQRLDMTLPIASRTLWWSHQAAVVLAGTVILAGSLAVLAGHTLMIGKINPDRAMQIPYPTLMPPLVAGLLLAAAMIGSLEPGLWKLRGRLDYWIFVVTSLFGILVILLLLRQKPWTATQFCLLMTGVITWLTLRKLPPAYRLEPKCAAPANDEVSVAATSASPVGRWQLLKILFDVLHTAPPWKRFTPLMLYFFVALMGFIIAGGLERVVEELVLRFLYIPMGSYMLLAGFGLVTYQLYRLDSLPISRRTLFAIMVLPGILIFVGGYLGGWLILALDPSPAPLVDYNVQKQRVAIDLQQGADAEPEALPTMAWVEVDQAFMAVSLSGEPPTLTSPWGESHQAWSVELFRGLSPILYSPYNTAEETTADFESLMLSNAIEDVYGQVVAPEAIRDRIFEIEDDRVVGVATISGQAADAQSAGEQGISSLVEELDPEARSKGPEMPVYLALVMVPGLLLIAFTAHSFRANRSNSYIRAMYWVGLGLLLGALIGQVLLDVFGVFDSEAARGFLAVFIQRLGTSPLSWILTWVVSLGAIVASYRVALAQFVKAEIPASPLNCSFIDFTKAP